MLYVVAYDVVEPTRLKKVAQCCELYGFRIEKSVFEVNLNDELFQQFWDAIQLIINPKEDSFVAYRICSACQQKIRTLGVVERPQNFQCIFL